MENQQGGALMDMGSNSALDMANRLNEMRAKYELTRQFFQDVMEKEVDYGIVPGTQKPSLFQPGADKLCSLYNLAKMIEAKTENKDYSTGHYDVTVKVRLVHRGTQIIAGEGEGCCSTWESKYRYRWAYEGDIPSNINKDTLVYKEKEGRNGPYKQYRIENDDLFSQWNTVLKMATKRAFVSAILSSTGLSGLFSQDKEDIDSWINGDDDQPGQDKSQPRQGQKRPPQGSRKSGSGGNSSAGTDPAATLRQQLSAIYSIGGKKGLSNDDVKALILLKNKKDIDALSSEEAATVITYLQKEEAGQLKAMLETAAEGSASLFPDKG